MPLDFHVADRVSFACESCGREQSTRSMRRFVGCCERCGAQRWQLTTTYYDGPVLDDVFHWFFRWAFEIYVVEEIEETTEIVTANVPGDDALGIARLGWKYKGAACRYMEMRRELDAHTERENQKTQGARNCARCGYFFVPAAGKPWTQVGYCSQACFGSANMAGEVSTSIKSLPQPPEVKSSKTIAVVCKKGHGFEVAAMYAGTFRPCPICQEKTSVN